MIAQVKRAMDRNLTQRQREMVSLHYVYDMEDEKTISFAKIEAKRGNAYKSIGHKVTSFP